MIARLRGPLLEKTPEKVVLDINGVGYQAYISLPTYSSLPDLGAEVVLDIHTHVREDAIQLFGFSTKRERSIFERLVQISGIGPRLAMTILSGSSVDDLVASIKREDLARLTSIPGIGKKTVNG